MKVNINIVSILEYIDIDTMPSTIFGKVGVFSGKIRKGRVVQGPNI